VVLPQPATPRRPPRRHRHLRNRGGEIVIVTPMTVAPQSECRQRGGTMYVTPSKVRTTEPGSVRAGRPCQAITLAPVPCR